MIRKFSGLCFLLSLLCTHIFAQSTIDISRGKLNISIGAIAGGEGAQAASVLANDLTMSGAFTVTDAGQAAYTASGSLGSSGLNGTLTDRNGKTLLSASFPGDWRHAAHVFADAIVETITGQKGIASSQVVFVSAQSGQKEIYIMDIDGANVRQLTNDKVISIGPKFSPNGSKIAYTSYKSGYPDVWAIDLASKNRKRVAFFPGVNSSPAYSPDGSQLALILSLSGNTELYTLPADGGSPNRLTRSVGTEASPTWSPDGRSIAYISDDRGSPQIYIIPSSGGASQRVNTSSSYTTEPDWSPDGSTLAYSVRAAGNNQIAVTSLSNSQQKILTSAGNNENPSWTRNSRHLLYSRGGNIYLLDSLSRESIQIKNGLGRCTEPNASR